MMRSMLAHIVLSMVWVTAIDAAACDGDNMHLDCCSYNNLCPPGQGDCDSSGECQTGLSCGEDNCQDFDIGAESYMDCCECCYVLVNGYILDDYALGGVSGVTTEEACNTACCMNSECDAYGFSPTGADGATTYCVLFGGLPQHNPYSFEQYKDYILQIKASCDMLHDVLTGSGFTRVSDWTDHEYICDIELPEDVWGTCGDTQTNKIAVTARFYDGTSAYIIYENFTQYWEGNIPHYLPSLEHSGCDGFFCGAPDSMSVSLDMSPSASEPMRWGLSWWHNGYKTNGFYRYGSESCSNWHISGGGWKHVRFQFYCDIDVCTPQPCESGGTCTDDGDAYTCACVTGYDGENCENSIPCGVVDVANSNAIECGSMVPGDECVISCISGFEFDDSSLSTVECSLGPNFSELPSCSNIDCTPQPCENGGSCTDDVDAYTCACVTGYDGDNCENSISLLVATEDAFVRGGKYANDNYGGKGKLKIKDAAIGRYNRIAFVQFDISSVRSSSFISISLKLCTKRNDDVNSNSVTIHVGNCAESFNEATLTWNTQPTTGDAICSNVPVGAIGSCIECNVITYVEDSLCSDATEIYFVIIDDFVSFVEFYSKDFGDPPLHPVLVVTSPVNSNLDNQINIAEAGTDHEQNGWPVNEAKDGILTGSDNGWAFSGIVPATAWFAFDKQYSIHKVTLLCDYNVNDHHITEFTLQYTTVIPPSQHSAWTNVPSPFFFGPFFTASIIDDHFKLSGQYEVVVGFSDVEATGLLLKVFDSDADNQNAVLTEILVYSSQPAGSSDAFANLAGSALDMSSSATNGQFPTSSANVDPQFPELQGGNSNGPQDDADNPTGQSNDLVKADTNVLPAQNEIDGTDNPTGQSNDLVKAGVNVLPAQNEPPDSNEPQDSGRSSDGLQNLE